MTATQMVHPITTQQYGSEATKSLEMTSYQTSHAASTTPQILYSKAHTTMNGAFHPFVYLLQQAHQSTRGNLVV